MAALMQQARTCIGTASQPPCRLGVLPVAWCRVARSSSSRSSSRRQQHLPHAAPGDGSSSTSGSSEFEGVPGGDEGVQDALLAQLRVQLEAESLKQEIKEDLQGKVEQMKAIGEDLISQLDAELDIEKFRTELESTQVLSDANDKFNELEEQLQQIKDQIQADQADLQRFEASSAAARSQGLFFRNLYQAPAGDEGEQQPGSRSSALAASSSSSSSSLDPAAARRAAAVVASTAQGEVSSPFRMYLFASMAAVLALVVAQDLATASPSLPLDGLYGVLGLLLGVNAANERSALTQVLQQRQEPQQQQKDEDSDSGTCG